MESILIKAVLTIIGTLIGIIYYHMYNRISSNEQRLNAIIQQQVDNDKECEERFLRVDKELTGVKVDLPKNYATKDDVIHLQTNLLTSLSGLGNSIGDLRKDIADLVKTKQDK